MKPDYQQIRTLAQLEEAIAGNRAEIVRQEGLMQRSVSRFQDVCTPRNLIGEGVRRFTQTYTFQTIALSLIGRLRRKLKKK